MTPQVDACSQAPNASCRPRSIFAELMICFISWISLVMLVAPLWSTSGVHFIYNASDSVPRGWYVVEAAPQLHVGDVVVVRLSRDVAALAAQRHYLPRGVPLIKSVAAVAPQHVCVDIGSVRVDGKLVGQARVMDSSGLPLAPWTGCRQLVANEVFLAGTHPASFDSRYFGPVDAGQVLGRARPLGKGGDS